MAEIASHGDVALEYAIVIVHEPDGSYVAKIDRLGVSKRGATDFEARSRATADALRAIAAQIETDQSTPSKISFAVWLGAKLPLVTNRSEAR
jgi:hypothetical protein